MQKKPEWYHSCHKSSVRKQCNSLGKKFLILSCTIAKKIKVENFPKLNFQQKTVEKHCFPIKISSLSYAKGHLNSSHCKNLLNLRSKNKDLDTQKNCTFLASLVTVTIFFRTPVISNGLGARALQEKHLFVKIHSYIGIAKLKWAMFSFKLMPFLNK